MGSKVNLFFEDFEIEELKEKLGKYKIIRLRCAIQFKTPTGWTKARDAIVDTGAHTTLIPLNIWKEAEVSKLTGYDVKGLSPDPACTIPVTVGEIKCVIVDEIGNQTPETDIHCLMADTDEVPLIVGFKDLLSNYKICFDYNKKEANIQI